MTQDYTKYASLEQVPFVGDHPVVMQPVTLVSNGTERTLVAGTVLGMVTASGKYDQCIVANADGTETAKRILAEDVTVPVSGDEQAVVYRHCEALKNGLIYDPAADAAGIAAINADLDAVGIYVK